MSIFDLFRKRSRAVEDNSPPAKEYRALPLYKAGDIPDEDLDLLERCDRFASLRAHADRICRDLGHPPDVASSMAEDLSDLADEGLLITRDALDSRWAPGREEPREPIATMCMPTADRPRELLRAATSLSDHCRKHDRRLSLLVLDDARSAPADVSALFGLDGLERVRAITRETREKMVSVLEDRGFDGPALRFSLLGHPDSSISVGANRNAGLLATAGERVFSMDDDTTTLAHPWSSPGLPPRMSSAADPTEFRFFDSLEDAIAREGEPEEDFLCALENLSGRSLRGALSELGSPSTADLSLASSAALRSLDADRGAVRIASTGFMGDNGMSGFKYYLYLRGESRDRLLAAGPNFDEMLVTRNVRRSVTAPTLSDSPFFMAGGFALDNARLLPPFFPCQRNGDGVFGGTLAALFPQDFIAHLPVMLAHKPPPDAARGEADDTGGIAPARTSDVLMRAVHDAAEDLPTDTAPEARMGHVGEGLRALADRSCGELRRILDERREVVVTSRAAFLRASMDLPSPGEGGRRWLEAVDRYAGGYEAELERGCLGVPHDLIRGGDVDRAVVVLKEMLDLYGRSILIWREVWESCAADEALRAVLFTDG